MALEPSGPRAPIQPSPSPVVRLIGVSKSFGSQIAVHPLDLEIERGAFLAILGPSGCGKTTLLRMIGGFETASSGRIEVEGADVTALPPERRPTNMVFQGYGLFPHMTVRQNVAYGLRLRRLPKAEIQRRTDQILELVHLLPLAERGIGQLSGGQQQRVAVARALIMQPPVLLFDEPFAALDLKLRQGMQQELRRIRQEVGGTFVFVTHDQEEALTLATRIAVMHAGRLEQIGTPEEIYLRPATRFVATFIGDANLLEGQRSGGVARFAPDLSIPSAGPDEPVTLMIRPDRARPLHAGEVPSDRAITGQLVDRVFLGTATRLTLALADGSRFLLQQDAGLPLPAPGAAVTACWDPAHERILAAQ